ncbi:MAG TPA: GGDEF domain-containing protein [Thermoanaerobaculia bacterium]|nr:GGDEF domain-containing protein [Thermoanaerobaculia bacterium]
MDTQPFALLVQAAGTILLFIVLLLLYRKFRRPAFLDWIASWGFFLAGLALLWAVRASGGPGESRVIPAFALNVAMLAHVFFLLRGVRRFRDERATSRPVDMLWALPILVVAWLLAMPFAPPATVALIRAAAYLVTAVSFARAPGSAAGRVLLSASFFLWAAERCFMAWGELHYGDAQSLGDLYAFAHFFEMFLEMTVAVGIILLLFEASQAELKREMERLVESDSQAREMGIRDRLTGLYNRHYFNDVIRRELARSRRHGGAISVLLVDVDRFKEINDVRGHQIGDEVLQFVANYLTACVRESDLVFRWGGDEFLVLLTQADEASAAQKAEELGRKLPHIPGAEQVQPTLSVGWATHRPKAEFPRTLAEADSRMYEMKLNRKKEREARERGPVRL